MDEFVTRQLLQAAQRTGRTDNGTAFEPSVPGAQYEGFQFVMVNYRNQQADPNSQGSEGQPTHGRAQRERPRVVQHEWDPNNPDDPVFLVQPDGGVGLAYQIPGTPSAKSVSLGPFAERQRRTPRERLAALRACTCMAAPVADDNEAQSPEGTGSNEDGSDSLTITTRPSPGTTRQSSRAGSRSGHGRSAPGRSKTGSKKRDVEYCAMNLDEAVLAQSLADTAAVLSQNGGETELAMHTAVAMLLEKDDSDDEKPDAKGVSSSTGATEQAKPEQ